MDKHPSLETLKRFATGTGSRGENRAVIEHLMQGCQDCSKTLRALMEPESVASSDYEEPLDRFDRGYLQELVSSIDPLEMLRDLPRGILLPQAGGEGQLKKR